MRIVQIVAYGQNRVIGKDSWNFKETTMGKVVIMGRNTFESVGVLRGRLNIVISKTISDLIAPSCSLNEEKGSVKVFPDLNTCLEFLEYFEEFNDDVYPEYDKETAYIIGGAGLYESSLKITDEILATEIKRSYIGDTFYPVIPKEFEKVEEMQLSNVCSVVKFARYGNYNINSSDFPNNTDK